ncbi:MAG TPA: DUF1684 domain-containing protein [Vicinamibacterales bacterium]|nr:DUF1684 domain-containing protein [Vicinamibacterales bacterium]
MSVTATPPLRRRPRGRPVWRLLVLAGVLAVGACTTQAPPDTTRQYVKQLLAFRAEKDAAFRTDADSPIPAAARATMLPLRYYPPNPAYRVPAVLEPAPTGDIMQIQTSTGLIRRMQEYGTLEFELQGRSMTLTAFVEEGSPNADRLFVPFTDLTSGKETYAGGRYLDLTRTPTGIYVIDFNFAYNPYCCYNTGYDCPYPPPQNRLPVAIRAGERLPSGAAPGA